MPCRAIPKIGKEMKRTKLWILAVAVSASLGVIGQVSTAQAAACKCNPGGHSNCPKGYHCRAGGCASGGAPSPFTFTGRCFKNPGGGVVKGPKKFSVQPPPLAKRARPRRLRGR
jgi:hypothetical protein